MSGVTVKVTALGGPALQQRLGFLVSRLDDPTALWKVVGRRGANELKSHFRKRNRVPNRLGGKRTNYWRRIADSVQNPEIEPRAVTITIGDPTFGQKLFGGRITAKNAKNLSLPVDPLAHGRTVAVFKQETGIELFFFRPKARGLGKYLAGKNEDGSSGIRVFYRLTPFVDQKPDPEALPKDAVFDAALLDETEKYVARLERDTRGN